jgi:hypothetical protein
MSRSLSGPFLGTDPFGHRRRTLPRQDGRGSRALEATPHAASRAAQGTWRGAQDGRTGMPKASSAMRI